MPPPHRPPARSVFGSLVLIAVVIGVAAGAFSYTAGWFSQRLTPDKMVDALTPPTGEPLGHRRNHAKGICFTGIFEANGAGSALSEFRFSPAVSIRSSGASISAPPIRTRPMRRSGCAAWDC